MTSDADDVEAIARRVAELVGQTARPVDAQTVAVALDVDRDWVYAHARELGVMRLGPGPKSPCASTLASCVSVSLRWRRSILELLESPSTLQSRLAGRGAHEGLRSRA